MGASVKIGLTLRIEQAQCPGAGFIVNPGEKSTGAKGGSSRSCWRDLACARRMARSPPGVRRRVFQGSEKHALWVLDAGDRLPVWRDLEKPGAPQPALVITEGTALAAAQIEPPDKSAFRAEVDVEIPALRLLGPHQKPSSSSSSPAVLPPFVSATGGPLFAFLPSADRTR